MPTSAMMQAAVMMGAWWQAAGVRAVALVDSAAGRAVSAGELAPQACVSVFDQNPLTCSTPGVKEVEICSNVTVIPPGAFFGCTMLEVVTIPLSVTTIGDSAFFNCTALPDITIPGSVTTIGLHAFKSCHKLLSVTIPNSVTLLGASAFSDCVALESVQLSGQLTTIGTGMFYFCIALESVTIPNSVTLIGRQAFNSCTALKQVTIGNSVAGIAPEAFANCANLEQVTMGTAISQIAPGAFVNTSLSHIHIPRWESEVMLPPPNFPPAFDSTTVVTYRTASPTPSPSSEEPAATGDPHVTNLAGERFDINRPGDHLLLRVPLEPSRPALLELRGLIRSDELKDTCAMYIRMVTMRGEWLGGSTMQVRPLRRNKPGSNVAGNVTIWPFSIREASSEGVWRSVADVSAGGDVVQVLSASVSVVGRARAEEFGNGPESQAFEFVVGRDAGSRASIIVSQGQRQSLNLRMKSLNELGEQRLGGLLGTEKHGREVEEPTEECLASKAPAAWGEQRELKPDTSRLSASW